jgi:hypothetical protein
MNLISGRPAVQLMQPWFLSSSLRWNPVSGLLFIHDSQHACSHGSGARNAGHVSFKPEDAE